jgi:hypothetical protein
MLTEQAYRDQAWYLLYGTAGHGPDTILPPYCTVQHGSVHGSARQAKDSHRTCTVMLLACSLIHGSGNNRLKVTDLCRRIS